MELSQPPRPAQSTCARGEKKRRPNFAVAHMVRIADRRYAATPAPPDPLASHTAATTCQVHCYPRWSSNGAVTAASTRSKHMHVVWLTYEPAVDYLCSQRTLWHPVIVFERSHINHTTHSRTRPDCERPHPVSAQQ